MTDAFLDDHETLTLTRDLRYIARYRPEIGRIAHRETSPPGGRDARNPNGYSSRPPGHLGAIHLCAELDGTMWSWCRLLHHELGITRPDPHPEDMANHLALHADRIATRPWGRTCYQHVCTGWTDQHDHHHPAWKTMVTHLVEPVEKSIADERNLTNIEVQARADEALGSAADMVVLHYAVTGKSIKESTIRSWRRKGWLPERYGPGMEPWYWYPEIAACAAASPPREGGVKAKTRGV